MLDSSSNFKHNTLSVLFFQAIVKIAMAICKATRGNRTATQSDLSTWKISTISDQKGKGHNVKKL